MIKMRMIKIYLHDDHDSTINCDSILIVDNFWTALERSINWKFYYFIIRLCKIKLNLKLTLDTSKCKCTEKYVRN